MRNFKEARRFTGLIMATALLTPGSVGVARAEDSPRVGSASQAITEIGRTKDYTSSVVTRLRYESPQLVWLDKGDRAVLSVDLADRKIDTVTCFEARRGYYCKEETFRVDRQTFENVGIAQRNFSPTSDQLDKRKDYKSTGVSVRYKTQVIQIAKAPEKKVWIDQGDHAVRGVDDSDMVVVFRKVWRPSPYDDKVYLTETVRIKDCAANDFQVGEKGVYVTDDQIKRHDTTPIGQPLVFKKKNF